MEQSKMLETVKSAQTGDNAALETLYEEYAKPVYYLALRLLANKEDAEDVAQEVFIKMLETIGDLKNPETFPTWLNRITVNKCNDLFRKNRVTLNIPDKETAKSDFFEVHDPLLIPDKAFDNAETADIITKIIDGLPIPQKVCIYYYYYERMTITQISESLDISESLVKNRLALAREKIKKAIEDIERKDGIKLYGALPLMLTPVLMKSLQNFEMPQSVLDGIFNTITANISNTAGTASTVTTSTAGTASTATTSTAGMVSAATTSTAGTASTAATTAATSTTAATTAATASAFGIKAVVAAIAGVVAIGGITAAILLSGNEEPEPETLPAAVVEIEPEAETTTTPPPETTLPPTTITPENTITTPETTTESEIATTSSETTTPPETTTTTAETTTTTAETTATTTAAPATTEIIPATTAPLPPANAVVVYDSPQSIPEFDGTDSEYMKVMSNDYIIAFNIHHVPVVYDSHYFAMVCSYDAEGTPIYYVTKRTFEGGTRSTPEEQARHWYEIDVSLGRNVTIVGNVLYVIEDPIYWGKWSMMYFIDMHESPYFVSMP